MMKKLCSAILILCFILSCIPAYAEDTYTANWIMEDVPDLKSMLFDIFIYCYDVENNTHLNTDEVDKETLDEIWSKVSNEKFITVNKKLPDSRLNKALEMPNEIDIWLILYDGKGEEIHVSLYKDYAIISYGVRNSLIYCEYTDSTLYSSITELLKPSVEKHKAEQIKKEEAKIDKGIPITDFKTAYKGTFEIPYYDLDVRGEWGLCSYKVGDVTRYCAYMNSPYKELAIKWVCEEPPTNNVLKINHGLNIRNMKEYTGMENSIGTVELTIDEDYQVIAMKVAYNKYKSPDEIDMSTYKAEGSLKDFADFKFVPNAVKAEEKAEVKEEAKPEDKTEAETEPSSQIKEPEKADNTKTEEPAKQEEEKKTEEVKAEDKKEEQKNEQKEEVKEEIKEEIKEEQKAEAPEKEEAEESIISQWAVEEVEKAMALGIAEKDKDYAYSRPITREEFCDLIYNYIVMLDMDVSNTAEGFADTDSEKIGLLYNMGIIKGKSESIFAPKDSLTREEAAVILYRTVNKTTEGLNITQLYFPFGDEDEIADWSAAEIQAICNLGIMKGVGEDRFAPKGIYTTEQAIATIVRMYETVE